MSSHGANPHSHFILVPLLAHGHLIPMTDLARSLAEHGALVTLITTPFNTPRIKTTIGDALGAGLPIRLAELPFPCEEAGLPPGCEHMDILPSFKLQINFFHAASLLRQPLELYLREQTPPPTCIIADMCQPWTHDVALSLGVPRLTFFSMSCFTLLSNYNISHHKVYESITDETEPFVIPGLTHKVYVTRLQAPGFYAKPEWEKMGREAREAELAADGIVMNTFDDLESSHLEAYQKAMGKKVWTIGPVSHCNKDVTNMTARGKEYTDANRCMNWLNSMLPGSVVYVNFGSITRMLASQLMEIGFGLEASSHAFIWVVKDCEWSPEVEEWMSAGFEERIASRGLIVRGWAPQVMILLHPAVGGFVTHCGWNSTVEALAAGVAMVAWPQFADQFLNERLVVDVLRVGVPVGVRVPSRDGWEEEEVAIGRNEVERAVRRIMDEGEEGEGMRKRAKELGERASKATKEGGSSHANLTHLVQYFSNK